MKTILLFTAVAATLSAQVPSQTKPVTDDTVIALVGGEKLTAGQMNKILDTWPPDFVQEFQKDPLRAIRDAFVLRNLASQAEKLNLADKSPWKEQLEVSRMNVMAQAMVYQDRNFYQVPTEEINDFYQKNQARYEEAKIKIIKIAFKPAVSGTLASGQSVEEQARLAFEAAHAGSDRTEPDATKLAADVVKQLRGGADFKEMVAKYSDDAESKAEGGDYGSVTQSGYFPADLKKAVFALNTGQVSDPIRQGPALYIIKLESKSIQPQNKVSEQIVQEIKQIHLGQVLDALRQEYTPAVQSPEFFLQYNATHLPKK